MSVLSVACIYTQCKGYIVSVQLSRCRRYHIVLQRSRLFAITLLAAQQLCGSTDGDNTSPSQCDLETPDPNDCGVDPKSMADCPSSTGSTAESLPGVEAVTPRLVPVNTQHWLY